MKSINISLANSIKAFALADTAINVRFGDSYTDAQPDINRIKTISAACKDWLMEFEAKSLSQRNHFRLEWEYKEKGKEFGLSYIVNYACALLQEMVIKRYEPTKKSMSAVNEVASKYLRKGDNRSIAMTKAHRIVSGKIKLHGESISSELDTVLEAMRISDSYDTLIERYDSLRVNANGEKGKYPNKSTCLLVISLTSHMATKMGFV